MTSTTLQNATQRADRGVPSLPTHSEIRWQAVVAKDGAAADRFVYAVRTTGIYCRPGCPSRRPLRQNIEFFDSPELAEQRGYRPCKKCRPNNRTCPIPDEIIEACRVLKSATSRVTLSDLARTVGQRPHVLHRLFKKHLGVTPKGFAAAV